MFSIDSMSRQPVYEQLIEQLERLVLTRILDAGIQIPSVRNLSLQLAINPNTIQKAYNELISRGLIFSVPGRGCFVAENALELIQERKREKLRDLDDLIEELALAGVPIDTIKKHVKSAYRKTDAGNGEKNDSSD